MKNLLTLKPYLLRYKRSLGEGFACIILTNIFAIIGPRYIGRAVDSMQGSFTMSEIVTEIALYILCALLSGLFLFLVRQKIIVTSRHIEYDLKNDYYHHLQQLPRTFYDRTDTGELISRGTNDLNAIRELLGPGIMYSINTFFKLFFAVIAMLTLSPMLTFFALLPAPLLSYSVYRIGRLIRRRSKSIQESYAAITNLVQENLTGIRVVKSYTRESLEIERFSRLNRDYYGKNLSLGKLQALFFAILAVLTAFSLLPVIWVGGMLTMRGEMSIGGIAQFIVYVTMLTWPIISIGWVTSIVQRAVSAQVRLNEIFSERPEIDHAGVRQSGGSVTLSKHGELSFLDVSFHYPSQPLSPVLKNISFTAEAGSKIAFVGATGSGKTTLVSLIARLYEAQGGKITLDGKDIRELPIETLRSRIGFIPQNNFLFSDTIERNIGYGSTGTPDHDKIVHAASVAMLDSEIREFPEQYRTMLGEKGINLSGGQKQRACIARAVARDPELLILDDALSAVDTATEATIFDALLRKLPNTTLILISHRISTVKNCDRIFLLDKGIIAEQGSHEELLKQNGLYTTLYNQQLLEEEISAIA